MELSKQKPAKMDLSLKITHSNLLQDDYLCIYIYMCVYSAATYILLYAHLPGRCLSVGHLGPPLVGCGLGKLDSWMR